MQLQKQSRAAVAATLDSSPVFGNCAGLTGVALAGGFRSWINWFT